MVHKRKCQRCKTTMISRNAPKKQAEIVRKITGQKIVTQYLCPNCYPEKVVAFVNYDDVSEE